VSIEACRAEARCLQRDARNTEVPMSIRQAAAELPVLFGMVLVIAAFFYL
jgi:hypothetical protein